MGIERWFFGSSRVGKTHSPSVVFASPSGLIQLASDADSAHSVTHEWKLVVEPRFNFSVDTVFDVSRVEGSEKGRISITSAIGFASAKIDRETAAKIAAVLATAFDLDLVVAKR